MQEARCIKVAPTDYVLKPLCADTVVELQRRYSWQRPKGGPAAVEQIHEQQCWASLRHSSERYRNLVSPIFDLKAIKATCFHPFHAEWHILIHIEAFIIASNGVPRPVQRKDSVPISKVRSRPT